jgi:uncharacterized protein (DUF2141 family)
MSRTVPPKPIWAPLWAQVLKGAVAMRAASLTALVLWLGSASLAQAASLQVVVSGITSAEGRVLISLCTNDFSAQNCIMGRTAPSTPGVMKFAFPDVEPGIYAIAVFQDLNGNGILDKTQNGLPLEPYGFSNGAGRSAAPRFGQAAVQVSSGAAISVRLTSIAARR